MAKLAIRVITAKANLSKHKNSYTTNKERYAYFFVMDALSTERLEKINPKYGVASCKHKTKEIYQRINLIQTIMVLSIYQPELTIKVSQINFHNTFFRKDILWQTRQAV